MITLRKPVNGFVFSAFFARLLEEENPTNRGSMLNQNINQLKTEEEFKKVMTLFHQHSLEHKTLKQHIDRIPKPSKNQKS